ncbi:23S rRNA (uracil(1939)-C(5))-methyltransferase RlmD [Obesumbacterium proteus]|uniref:23S rRNA (uracil(1939)-C(5))-methyltransferase RlmD n=1 Tax=Obesumbacterium proteus TaxID=82983 RepID=UPI001F2215CC|nr:23S rRNA (uracil(1939)-C(5))-methyltransferase RlmD [Obesumbacterium proteus]MCE9886697.1 23S rRNA (uracil(1939)-C(5))-methyltransferase RlmD [Obesumbacterium proteus]MCE9916226.1 23S rRNA (uracil(1939)-C(5))-methyltransferase RlmD [Obesumbacterium proteus]MCE9931717.1 23S rRNA (uracil(1939)-C(5))-methyltransferase RlmD [Obesumbacterium proteus]MCG2877015.1 23S rRNA (uracil(1939)-C(5))-methyltransferase RlmD [Obesumbacterium proteus]
MAQFYSPGRRVATRQTITVTATDLDPFGQGVARHNGKAIFISGLLPDEQAEVTLTEDKKQFARAKVKRLLTRSPERVAPRCPHFGICGGCQQQHASEPLQQRSKSASLQRLISRETGLDIIPESVISGPEYGYRRRARLGLQFQPKQQQLVMGFRKSGSNDLVPVKACPVLAPALASLLQPLHECLAGMKAVRRLGHAELVLADNGPVLVLRHLDPLKEQDLARLHTFSAQHRVMLYLQGNEDELVKLCDDVPFYQVDGLRLFFSPRDFIQVNDAVNQRMVAQALEWLEVESTDRVLDLFCGMGNFTLPLAKRAKQVVGVEGVATLVANGLYNAQINALNNVEFFQHNLEDDVTRQPWAKLGFDKVLLDPARAGAAGVMDHIVKLAPQKVVYVSCNPTTLARDSQILIAAGYRMDRVRMLDMFPHTGHLESMALFVAS